MREERPRPACADEDPELFFPITPRGDQPTGRRAYRAQVEEAKAVCASCPLQTACLERHIFEPEGIFAGTTVHDREILRRGDGRRGRSGPPITSYSASAVRKRDLRARQRAGLVTTRPLSQNPRAVRERARRERLKRQEAAA